MPAPVQSKGMQMAAAFLKREGEAKYGEEDNVSTSLDRSETNDSIPSRTETGETNKIDA